MNEMEQIRRTFMGKEPKITEQRELLLEKIAKKEGEIKWFYVKDYVTMHGYDSNRLGYGTLNRMIRDGLVDFRDNRIYLSEKMKERFGITK